MFVYNTTTVNLKSNKKINSVAKTGKKKSSKSKQKKSGGRVKSLSTKNVKFLKSLGFKVRKSRKSH